MSENEKRYLKGPGRPSVGKRSYSGKCDIRLSKEEDSMLNELSQRNGVTRSDVMRRALLDFWKFNNGGKD